MPFFRLRISLSNERLIFGLVDALRADLSLQHIGRRPASGEPGRKTPVRTAIGGKRAEIDPLRGPLARLAGPHSPARKKRRERLSHINTYATTAATATQHTAHSAKTTTDWSNAGAPSKTSPAPAHGRKTGSPPDTSWKKRSPSNTSCPTATNAAGPTEYEFRNNHIDDSTPFPLTFRDGRWQCNRFGRNDGATYCCAEPGLPAGATTTVDTQDTPPQPANIEDMTDRKILELVMTLLIPDSQAGAEDGQESSA